MERPHAQNRGGYTSPNESFIWFIATTLILFRMTNTTDNGCIRNIQPIMVVFATRNNISVVVIDFPPDVVLGGW